MTVPRLPRDWIWNKGLAAHCDHRVPDEFAGGRYAPVMALYAAEVIFGRTGLIVEPEALAGQVEPGDLVWVRGPWLQDFVERVLPHVRNDFVLLTADSDSSLPSEAWPEAQVLLRSPRVLHWFTQNHDGHGPPGRISPMPIGVDFHSLASGPRWGEGRASPADQALVLDEVVASLPPLAERAFGVYVDFRPADTRPRPGATLLESRREILGRFAGHPLFVLQAGPLPRSEMWRRKGQYQFSLSPHGFGLDCHRTWEALALGQIVLVPSSSLDPVFAGTRAVAVRSWDDITAANLAHWAEAAVDLPDPEAPVTISHWVERIRATTSTIPDP